MQGNSRVVTSTQSGPHSDLERTVRRHLAADFAKPIGAAAQDAYEVFVARWQAAGQPPLVFDSGCGVGDSTRLLAARHPAALVVGIDKSEDRLTRQKPHPLPANALLLRADAVDFWRLAVADKLRLAQHYLLYPNPWPKVGHLQRRWHGHAVFPSLLALGGRLELRSNWRVYVEEFTAAVAFAGRDPASVEIIPETELAAPLTPFERKYHASGQALFRCVITPDPPPECRSA
jgi:tRNA (guanine-N7-)-methyltransferase